MSAKPPQRDEPMISKISGGKLLNDIAVLMHQHSIFYKIDMRSICPPTEMLWPLELIDLIFDSVKLTADSKPVYARIRLVARRWADRYREEYSAQSVVRNDPSIADEIVAEHADEHFWVERPDRLTAIIDQHIFIRNMPRGDIDKYFAHKDYYYCSVAEFNADVELWISSGMRDRNLPGPFANRTLSIGRALSKMQYWNESTRVYLRRYGSPETVFEQIPAIEIPTLSAFDGWAEKITDDMCRYAHLFMENARLPSECLAHLLTSRKLNRVTAFGWLDEDYTRVVYEECQKRGAYTFCTCHAIFMDRACA